MLRILTFLLLSAFLGSSALAYAPVPSDIFIGTAEPNCLEISTGRWAYSFENIDLYWSKSSVTSIKNNCDGDFIINDIVVSKSHDNLPDEYKQPPKHFSYGIISKSVNDKVLKNEFSYQKNAQECVVKEFEKAAKYQECSTPTVSSGEKVTLFLGTSKFVISGVIRNSTDKQAKIAGENVHYNDPRAIDCCAIENALKTLKSGDWSSELNLAYLYMKADKRRNVKEAEKWFRKAALSAQPSVQIEAASFYLGYFNEKSGEIFNPDYAEAIKYLNFAINMQEKSAAYFVQRAKCMLSQLYSEGKGIEKDTSKARELLGIDKNKYDTLIKREPVNDNLVSLSLAKLYLNTRCKREAKKDAVYWLQISADLGNAEAQYEFTINSEPAISKERRVYYLRKSALQGYEPAQRAISYEFDPESWLDSMKLEEALGRTIPNPPPSQAEIEEGYFWSLVSSKKDSKTSRMIDNGAPYRYEKHLKKSAIEKVIEKSSAWKPEVAETSKE